LICHVSSFRTLFAQISVTRGDVTGDGDGRQAENNVRHQSNKELAGVAGKRNTTAENRSVGGSIPPLGTKNYNETKELAAGFWQA